MNPHRRMQKWERKTIKTAREADDLMEQNDQPPRKRGVGRPVKKVLPLLEERTPGCKGCRGESHHHLQACWLNQPIWQDVAKRVERDTLEEETAQTKQRIEEEQRHKAGRPGSCTDPDAGEPEKKVRRSETMTETSSAERSGVT